MRPAAALLVALTMLAGDPKAEPAAKVIQLSFKLDPRLSGATYGGERWVSPPTYQGSSGQNAVEARAATVDANGTRIQATIDWKTSDPEMVTVSPARGGQVTITVKRTGESSLTVTAGAVSRKLGVTAVDRNGARLVTITQ